MANDARQYARIRYRLILIELAGWLAFITAYQASGLSHRTASWAAALSSLEPVRLAGYLAVFGAIVFLVFLPLRWYGGFSLEHRFGLSRLRVKGWLIRDLKHAAVSAGIGLVVMEVWYALLRHLSSSWPLYATLGWIIFSVLLARVFPTLLLPIFYKTTPLADETLRARLLQLCERARLKALGVFRVDLGVETRKANAALAGIGGTRRVLVSDTLLKEFSSEEIETVLAHELGHQRHRHILQFLILSSIGSWLAFLLIQHSASWWMPPLDLTGLSDLAGVPVLLAVLSLLNLIALPLTNGISRRFEWQADRFAVSLTQLPHAFASALRKLGELNLADPAPPRWIEWLFFDHPAVGKRIAAAEAARSAARGTSSVGSPAAADTSSPARIGPARSAAP